MKTLDLEFVRSCFPAFKHPLPAKTAFFENAGGSYVAGPVLEQYMHFYSANKVQPYGASEICHAAGEQMDAGRKTMAELLGVDKGTVTIGPSTTQNFNTLAVACQAIVHKGDSVIVTQQDHEANIGAWERLCQRQQADLKHWPIEGNGELNIAHLETLIDDSVKVISLAQLTLLNRSSHSLDHMESELLLMVFHSRRTSGRIFPVCNPTPTVFPPIKPTPPILELCM